MFIDPPPAGRVSGTRCTDQLKKKRVRNRESTHAGDGKATGSGGNNKGGHAGGVTGAGGGGTGTGGKPDRTSDSSPRQGEGGAEFVYKVGLLPVLRVDRAGAAVCDGGALRQ